MKINSQIAAAYWNSPIRSTYLSDDKPIIILNGLAGVDHTVLEWTPHVFKLILKPISALSEADGKELAKMFGATWTKIDGNFMQMIKDDDMVAFYCVFPNTPMPVKLIDFLRSRSYDVGFGEIPSLIEAGIALNALTYKL